MALSKSLNMTISDKSYPMFSGRLKVLYGFMKMEDYTYSVSLHVVAAKGVDFPLILYIAAAMRLIGHKGSVNVRKRTYTLEAAALDIATDKAFVDMMLLAEPTEERV